MPVIAKPVGLNAVQVLGRNKVRTSVALINNNSTAILYWAQDDPAVATVSGLPIFPRGSVTLSVLEGDDPTLSMWVVSDTAGQDVRAYEGIARARD